MTIMSLNLECDKFYTIDNIISSSNTSDFVIIIQGYGSEWKEKRMITKDWNVVLREFESFLKNVIQSFGDDNIIHCAFHDCPTPFSIEIGIFDRLPEDIEPNYNFYVENASGENSEKQFKSIKDVFTFTDWLDDE